MEFWNRRYQWEIYVIGGVQSYPSGLGLATVEEYTPESVVAVENNAFDIPSSFALHQNYPNPFNPETRIRYKISKPARVVLQVMNLTGQKIRTLVDEDKPVGAHEVVWNGRDNHGQRAASGMYLYRLEVNNFLQTRKMVLLQ